jgi:hypothetical protein
MLGLLADRCRASVRAAVSAVLVFASGLRHALSDDLPGVTQPEAVTVLADYIAVRTTHAPGCGDGQLAS